ncbi:hypothetical protein [Undibacterium sp.]|uniref:hypothetical protein n=1 Tax=Undibacterium sp. TaxID=1914977 RepID=UPI00374CA8A6
MHALKMIAETVAALMIPFSPMLLGRRPQVLPQEQWPLTMADTVDSLLSRMSAQDKAMVKATKQEDLVIFYHRWGSSIRRYYGLENGNHQLLDEATAGRDDADLAARKIIEAVWLELQRS